MKDLRINVGSIEVQVREYEREGDAVIFLHFGGANLVMWQDVVPYFRGDYRLILVDLRGHGKSDKPQTGYHIDEMARDVAGVMTHLKIERAHIVGSSLGAEVGLSMAANDPEKVTSLVCEGALYSEYGPYGVWEGSEAEFKAHVARTLEKRRDTAEPVFASVDALVDERRQRRKPPLTIGAKGSLDALGKFFSYFHGDAKRMDLGAYLLRYGRKYFYRPIHLFANIRLTFLRLSLVQYLRSRPD